MRSLNNLFFSFPELSSLRTHFKYRGRGEQKGKRAGSLPAGKNLIETVKALETYFSVAMYLFVEYTQNFIGTVRAVKTDSFCRHVFWNSCR